MPTPEEELLDHALEATKQFHAVMEKAGCVSVRKAEYDDMTHTLKQVRQMLGCDGSTLEQIAPAILKLREDKARLDWLHDRAMSSRYDAPLYELLGWREWVDLRDAIDRCR